MTGKKHPKSPRFSTLFKGLARDPKISFLYLLGHILTYPRYERHPPPGSNRAGCCWGRTASLRQPKFLPPSVRPGFFPRCAGAPCSRRNLVDGKQLAAVCCIKRLGRLRCCALGVAARGGRRAFSIPTGSRDGRTARWMPGSDSPSPRLREPM